jgi:maltose/moltooligosaccharide transporter
MVPKERTGVYMGIVNMMIVVPMLVQTLTFGWIFQNLLNSDGTNAIMFAGVLLGCGALAMLWVNPPRENEESSVMPLGAPTEITVYDRVVVGSDGTPASLKTVHHAAAVAAAADARLVVVSAYNPEPPNGRASRTAAAGEHQELYGEEAARAALRTSINELSNERVRNTETRIVEGDPAKALLEVAGSNPANVIVVGNRGLGAAGGQLLGSVPGDVAKNAACDVLIVQTSDVDGDPVTAHTGESNGSSPVN